MRTTAPHITSNTALNTDTSHTSAPKIIALIPARSGSKRIPRKNIKPFCGKPIIAYPITTALESKLFSRVIVSTDSQHIADIAQSYGAQAPFLRPSSLSDDFTPTAAVAAHAAQELGLDSSDVLCVIYPTTPLLQARFLAQGLQALLDSSAAYSFGALEYSYNPYRSFCIKKSGANGENSGVSMLFPEHYHKRSQDLPRIYHDAGQFYFGRVWAWHDELPIFAPHSRPIVLPHSLAHDIDTLEDWNLAELKFRAFMDSSSATLS